MSFSSLSSERFALVATVDPDAYTTGTFTSDYVDMGDFERLLAVVAAGTLGSSGTLNAKLVQATSAAGAGKKDITGKAITALTEAGSDSDKQALINLKSDELDVVNSFRYVAVELTLATAGSDAAVLVFGEKARYQPASDYDLASVDEIVG